jgi:hypothetical protein
MENVPFMPSSTKPIIEKNEESEPELFLMLDAMDKIL